ncbi:MAG TPA: ABC transporter permease [Bacteroidales bacterium]|nr:ABC transporter permease [Bacteroidales bacterium]
MNYTNLFRIAGRALVRNKLRAVLTMLGIVIGVASVIAMLAIGEGSKQSIKEKMSSMGTNMIIIMPIRTKGVNGLTAMKYSDVEILRNEAADISSVSPEVRTDAQVIFGNENTPTTVFGVSEEYFTIRKLGIKSGRLFNAGEIKSMSKVCLLGQTVVDKLFGKGADPVGMNIRIKKLPFVVIGVLKEKGENGMGLDLDDCIIAPYTTVQRRLAAIDHINGIYVSAISDEKGVPAITEAQEILRRTHKLKDTEENDFAAMSQSELIKTASSVTDIMTYLLGAIAGISLLVGGIGIMNIMFVSVTERTREIGLRMSVGGRNRDIMSQFLVESMLLSLLGGAIGIVSGYIIGQIAGSFMNSPAIITTRSVFLAFIVCFAIGVFFGWYPARKAANLNPIDALRFE